MASLIKKEEFEMTNSLSFIFHSLDNSTHLSEFKNQKTGNTWSIEVSIGSGARNMGAICIALFITEIVWCNMVRKFE